MLRARLILLIACVFVAASSVPAFFCPWWEIDETLVVSSRDDERPWMNAHHDMWRFSSGRPEDVAAKVHNGLFPWWTSPRWRYALWRPLTSGTIDADAAVFHRWRPGFQIQSL